MKRVVATLLKARSNLFEVAGFVLLAVAAWQVSPPLGLAVAGASLLFMGWALGGRR